MNVILNLYSSEKKWQSNCALLTKKKWWKDKNIEIMLEKLWPVMSIKDAEESMKIQILTKLKLRMKDED